MTKKKYLLLYYKTSPEVEVVVITLPLVPATWITFIFKMSSSRSSSCKQITKKPKQREKQKVQNKKNRIEKDLKIIKDELEAIPFVALISTTSFRYQRR